MHESTRFRCSPWAQQGSNLRPLGEQHPYDQRRSNPTDLVKGGRSYDRVRHGSTTLVDAKWTADLGRRVVDTTAAFVIAAVILPAVWWVTR